jgi:hypothetical protein
MSPKEFTYRLNLYDSQIIFPFREALADIIRPAGVYTERVAISGNSILSTLWVKTIDVGATVTARWYDIGPGNNDLPGEKIWLTAHIPITTADTSDRRVVTRLHNKGFCEVTVAGGSAVFGIYATVISDFPQSGGYLDGQPVVVEADGGNATVIFDPIQNKFFLARGSNGIADVNVVGGTIYIGAPGAVFTKKNTIVTDGTEQTVIHEQVPTGKIWRLVKVKFISPAQGRGDIIVNGTSIDEALTSPAENNVNCSQDPYRELAAGQWLDVKFKRYFGPTSANVTVVATLTQVDE